MHRSARLLLPLTLVLCAACSKPGTDGQAAATQPAASASADPAAAASAPDAEAPTASGDTGTVTLTMGKVDAYLAATRNAVLVIKAHPDDKDEIAIDGDESPDAYAKRIGAHPEIVAAFAKAGLSPREYAEIGDTLIGGLMAVAMLDAGTLKELPEGIDPKMVEFIRAHKTEIEARMKALDPSATS